MYNRTRWSGFITCRAGRKPVVSTCFSLFFYFIKDCNNPPNLPANSVFSGLLSSFSIMKHLSFIVVSRLFILPSPPPLTFVQSLIVPPLSAPKMLFILVFNVKVTKYPLILDSLWLPNVWDHSPLFHQQFLHAA